MRALILGACLARWCASVALGCWAGMEGGHVLARWLLVLPLLALVGCTSYPGYIEGKAAAVAAAKQGIADVQNTHDLEAQGFAIASCQVTLGAWLRLPSADARRTYANMCMQGMGLPPVVYY